jgi:anthranilate phosphoribosyltransferase
VQAILTRLCNGHDLTEAEAEAAMRTLMEGRASPAQVGAFLAALRCKGETVSELLGCARGMRAVAVPVRSRHPLLADTCGTGGDGVGTFNISTTAALVVAGAGVPVAKHGNRAASSRSGSADVLEALGVRLDLEPAAVEECLDEVGFAFLFAQRHHPAMRHVAGPRRELGFRTVFNLLGPLSNPAGAQVQLVGVPAPQWVLPMAQVLQRLGTRRALVVHGAGGLDELSLAGANTVADTAAGAEPAVAEWAPEDAGLPRAPVEALRGGASPQENAAITEAILRGERGPRRDVVVFNAAAVLCAAGAAADLRGGVRLAEESLDSGRAWGILRRLVETTTRLATAAG